MQKSASTPWWAWLAGALALIGAIGIGLYIARTGTQPVGALPGQSALAPSATTAPAGPTIQHPIDEAAAGAAGTLVGSYGDAAMAPRFAEASATAEVLAVAGAAATLAAEGEKAGAYCFAVVWRRSVCESSSPLSRHVPLPRGNV